MIEGLTEKQNSFVDAYCGEADLDIGKAAKIAGYAQGQHLYKRLMRNPKVKTAVEQRLLETKRRAWLTEDKILEQLWKEATKEGKGSSHAARINALVVLGKHLGMFQEKKEETGPGKIEYKIINYNNAAPIKKIEKVVEEHKEEVIQHLDDPSPIEGLRITNYAEDSE